MSSTSPQSEYASAYFVQDRSNSEEMARLEIQDKMLTTFPASAPNGTRHCSYDAAWTEGGQARGTVPTPPSWY
jgi:hypothetical protein